MPQTVEKTGKSVEEAIQQALEELQCTRDEIEIEILTAPAKGFLGILGAKDAKIRAWRKSASDESEISTRDKESAAAARTPAGSGFVETGVNASVSDKEDTAEDKVTDFIIRVTALMGIEAAVVRKETEETLCYTLSGERMGAVIGRRGDTLDALQYLSNIIAGKGRDDNRKRIIVDAEDYRRRREETLIRLADRLAAKAKKSGRRVVLEPMSPMERRVIHTALQSDTAIRTQSEGEEPYRRLVIYPASGGSRDTGTRYDREGRTRGGAGSGQRQDRQGARRSLSSTEEN